MTETVRAERNGQRIELRGWVGQQTPKLCKSVAGARFNGKDPRDKFWAYPLDMSTCRALRTAFGEQLRVGVELAEWAKTAIAEEQFLATIASGDGSAVELDNVDRFAPRISAAMASRTYQRTAAAMLARSGSFALFDQPGLGKTIETLGALVQARGGQAGLYLVLCPKVAVSSVWAAEIEQWVGERAVAFAVTGTRAQRQSTLDSALGNVKRGKDVFIVANIEMARIKPVKGENGKPQWLTENAEWPELFSTGWDAVIVDESHRALIRTSGTPTQLRAGMMKLRAERRIALSGTPMRGKPDQLWGTLNWMRPDLFTSYWRWVERYFELTSNGFSNYVLGGFKPGGEERLAQDMKAHSLRRTKAEVLPELPAKQYAGTYLIPGDTNSPLAVWLDMEPKQAKLYRQLIAEAAVVFEDGTELIADGILAQNTRAKQFAGAGGTMVDDKFTPALPSAKFDWLVQKLDELGILEGEGEARIVVASQFTSLLNVFAKELTAMGVRLHLLTGETPDKARQAMVKDFQNDGATRVFLLNTKAGGVAVTLDAADDLVLLDETYVPDDQEQVEDRIHRTSRMHSVTIYNLRMLDTIEEEISWITAAREDVTKYLLDGSRGVATARAIYEAKAAA